jgi:hypothetical protein
MGGRTLAAVVEPTAGHPVKQLGLLSRLDNLMMPGDQDATLATPAPQVMPTGSAQYCSTGDEIKLQCGALLIKVDKRRPVYVSSVVDSNEVSVRLGDGALVLVSNLDGRMTVVNLADSGRDSCTIYMADKNSGAPGQMNLRVGHLAEFFPSSFRYAENEVLSYTVPNTIPMTNDLTLEVMRVSYPRTMKRFNLIHTLAACDKNRILKTAAATSFEDSEREWYGEELRAR